jgi:hypothetical protein
VINAPEVLEVLHDLGVLGTYLNAFYDGQYRAFFVALGPLPVSVFALCACVRLYAWVYAYVRMCMRMCAPRPACVCAPQCADVGVGVDVQQRRWRR